MVKLQISVSACLVKARIAHILFHLSERTHTCSGLITLNFDQNPFQPYYYCFDRAYERYRVSSRRTWYKPKLIALKLYRYLEVARSRLFPILFQPDLICVWKGIRKTFKLAFCLNFPEQTTTWNFCGSEASSCNILFVEYRTSRSSTHI